MGISIQEFLSGRVACPVCDAKGDQEHCITALLSRIDSCIIFNSMYHNQNSRTDSDTALLQNLRATTDPNQVLDYYVRSERVVQRINAREDHKVIWDKIYRTYIPPMLVKVRAGQKQAAVDLLNTMLAEVEARY